MKLRKHSRGLAALWMVFILGLASEAAAQVQYERFAGVLQDSGGNPLIGTVSVISENGEVGIRSQADGTFALFAPYAERYIINASAPGHLPYAETDVEIPQEDLKLQLAPAETFTINPTQLAQVSDSRGTLLQLPAGALVDSQGRLPAGDITVSMYTYGSGSVALPGNRTGVRTDGQRTALRSLGAVSVEFTDGNGISYNLAAGRRARLTVRLPDGAVEPAPVPLWSYNPRDGLWYQGQGFGTQSGSVIVGEVEHFSTWIFADELANPACIALTMDADWFAGAPKPVIMRAAALGASLPSNNMNISSVGPHSLINLAPNSLVQFWIKNSAGDFSLYAIVNTGAAWGGTGVPENPSMCQGHLTVHGGNFQVGTVKGRVLLQHGGSHAGVDVKVSSDGVTLKGTTDANGNFEVAARLGAATVSARKEGYLPVGLQGVTVTPSPAVTNLGDATLLAGDMDGNGCVDTGDMRAINAAIPSPTSPVNQKLDVNGDQFIDFTDLRLAAGNGRQCGPRPW